MSAGSHQPPISLFLEVWGLLFVLSFLSYLVEYYGMEGFWRSDAISTGAECTDPLKLYEQPFLGFAGSVRLGAGSAQYRVWYGAAQGRGQRPQEESPAPDPAQ